MPTQTQQFYVLVRVWGDKTQSVSVGLAPWAASGRDEQRGPSIPAGWPLTFCMESR